jgi:hypothetical protein
MLQLDSGFSSIFTVVLEADPPVNKFWIVHGLDLIEVRVFRSNSEGVLEIQLLEADFLHILCP